MSPKIGLYLGRKERGTTIILICIMLVVLVGLLGLPVDTARQHFVESKAQAALDAAGLAAVKVERSPYRNLNEYKNALKAEANSFMQANFCQQQNDVECGEIVLNLSHDLKTVALNTSLRMKPSFTTMLGVKDLDIAISNETKRERPLVEVALALDMYRRESTTNHVPAIKSAAHAFVEDFLPEGGSSRYRDRLISLIPYGATVNIGTQNGHLMDGAWPLDVNSRNVYQEWKGCVMADRGGQDVTDNVPGTVGPFLKYFFWDSENYAGNWFNHWDINMISFRYRYPQSLPMQMRGPNLGCPLNNALTPLTSDKQELHTNINAMYGEGWYRGGRITNLGAAWAFRAVSPKWQRVWRTHEGYPLPVNLPYSYPNSRKFVIMVSTGQDEFFVPDHDNFEWLEEDFPSDYSAYERKGQNLTQAQLSERTLQTCSAMKAAAPQDEEPITVYTVSVGLGPAGDPVMQACASSVQHHRNVQDASELQNIMQEVSREIKGHFHLSK